MVFSADDVHAALTGVGAAGAVCALACAELPDRTAATQLDARATPLAHITYAAAATTTIAAWRTIVGISGSAPSAAWLERAERQADQLVQLSVAGLVVTVAAPPLAVTPVSDGNEK